MQKWKRVIVPILILFVSLLLDGVITSLFTAELQTSIGIMSPKLFVLAVVVLAYYLEPRHIYILTLLFGFIYDSYYSGILGIYMTVMTLIAYFIIQLRPFIEPNMLVLVLISIIMLTINEFFLFSVYRAIGLTEVTISQFMAERLGATLALNTVLIALVGYPLKRILEAIEFEDKEPTNKSRII